MKTEGMHQYSSILHAIRSRPTAGTELRVCNHGLYLVARQGWR